jgi:hypothetical protein
VSAWLCQGRVGLHCFTLSFREERGIPQPSLILTALACPISALCNRGGGPFVHRLQKWVPGRFFSDFALRCHSEQRVRALLGARSEERGIPQPSLILTALACPIFALCNRGVAHFCAVCKSGCPDVSFRILPYVVIPRRARNPSAASNSHRAGMSHLCVVCNRGGGHFCAVCKSGCPQSFSRAAFLILPYRSHTEQAPRVAQVLPRFRRVT